MNPEIILCAWRVIERRARLNEYAQTRLQQCLASAANVLEDCDYSGLCTLACDADNLLEACGYRA